MRTRTEDHIQNFSRREEMLLSKAKYKGIELPERLLNWRHWIQDSAIYLNELKNLVDTSP